uniref:Secreted protein n=1 Tax=Octopus bimaculoides TaxID=37653 RepID=A0A0L8GZG0_OCTBM
MLVLFFFDFFFHIFMFTCMIFPPPFCPTRVASHPCHGTHFHPTRVSIFNDIPSPVKISFSLDVLTPAVTYTFPTHAFNQTTVPHSLPMLLTLPYYLILSPAGVPNR